MANAENLKKGKATQFKSGEKAAKAGAKGGIKSGKSKRAKKAFRENVISMLNSQVKGDKTIETLERLGVETENQNYFAAVAASVINKAMKDGDIGRLKYLIELTGEDEIFGMDGEGGGVTYPVVQIPDNGRDTRQKNVLAPQAGPQTMFMTNGADIIIYGGRRQDIRFTYGGLAA